MKADWIICSQRVGDLQRYSGPVLWINQCLRCNMEEPAYEGNADVLIYQARQFIKIHSQCKKTKS